MKLVYILFLLTASCCGQIDFSEGRNYNIGKDKKVKEKYEEKKMLDQIAKIVREASELMKPENIEVEQKGNESNYVTTADVNVQNFLKERLLALLPGSSFVGEEGDEESADTEYIWVVDPIDGTSNFIRDLGLSAISVGLLRDRKPYIGVVYQPYRDEMYTAKVGEGAFLNGKRIHVSDRDFRHSHLCSAMSLYNKDYAPPCFRIIERVYAESDDLRRLGTAAVEMVYLAAGRVELYFEIRLFPWDVAAAIPIITEAGGYVELMFEDKLPLNRPMPVIAANTKENFERLKEIVYAEIPERLY